MLTTCEFPVVQSDFTIFGFTKNPRKLLVQDIPLRFGIKPTILEYGSAGSLFLFSSYGDIAESVEVIALKLGFVRSLDWSPLSTKQLVEQKVISSDGCKYQAFHGNALLVIFSKTQPTFWAFKTILSIPQLYYCLLDDGIICSDNLRCIVRIVDEVRLDEKALPMHFLFRSVPGERTYFDNVQRMLPGQYLDWIDGKVRLRLVQGLRFEDDNQSFITANKPSLQALSRSLQQVIGDYVTQIESRGQSLANLLSGGVDSSLVQSYVNEVSSRLPTQSFSFAARVPSFQFEIDYAEYASQFLKTEHTFVDLYPQDFPDLLIKTIDILAQPPVLTTEPSILTIAEYVQKQGLAIRYFFSGQGADTLFGLRGVKKLKLLNVIQHFPFAISVLNGIGTLLRPMPRYSQIFLKGANILSQAHCPDAFVSPSNTIAVYVELDAIRRIFGDQVVRDALRYRRALAEQYLKSEHYLERVYLIDLLTDTYELGVQRQQLFLAHCMEQVHPFFDQDILRIAFTFHPDVRYIKGFREKYLLKSLLESRTGSPVIAKRSKGASVFDKEWFDWMQTGPLRPLVEDIHIPGFLSRSEYISLLKQPSRLLWGVLTYDLFRKSKVFQKGSAR
jgi:asparagine synthetase B (glutamine-hydrolysing)